MTAQGVAQIGSYVGAYLRFTFQSVGESDAAGGHTEAPARRLEGVAAIPLHFPSASC